MTNKQKKVALLSLAAAAMVSLAGCGSHSDIDDWMKEASVKARANVAELAVPKPYAAEQFDNSQGFDPFGRARMAEVIQRISRSVSPEIAAEFDRPKTSALEDISLDQIQMMGIVEHGGRVAAIVKAGGTNWLLKVGDRLGTNHGKVTSITESRIAFSEVVMDGTGQWVRQENTLKQLVKAPTAPTSPAASASATAGVSGLGGK